MNVFHQESGLIGVQCDTMYYVALPFHSILDFTGLQMPWTIPFPWHAESTCNQGDIVTCVEFHTS